MKFDTKPIRQYTSHLRHVATLPTSLPWEIKNSNFVQIFSRYGRKCKQIAFVHRFYARYMLLPVRLSVVCLSVICLSVTLVHSTQLVEIFGNISTVFGIVVIH